MADPWVFSDTNILCYPFDECSIIGTRVGFLLIVENEDEFIIIITKTNNMLHIDSFLCFSVYLFCLF